MTPPEGGRPPLDLTDGERAERRRGQQEAYRRRKGIPPRQARTSKRTTNWAQAYLDIWGKPPWQPLTPEEYAAREPLWNAWVEGRLGGRLSLDSE